METLAKGEGFEMLWLGVWEDNEVAIGVYEKLGFGKVGEHDFVIGEVVQRDFIMVKKI